MSYIAAYARKPFAFHVLLIISCFVLPTCHDMGADNPPPQEKPFCPTSFEKEYYYYYFAEKRPLRLLTDQITLQFTNAMTRDSVIAFVRRASGSIRTDSILYVFGESADVKADVWIVRLVPNMSVVETEILIDSLKRFDEVWYSAGSLRTFDNFRVWLTNEFSVKLRDSSMIGELYARNARFGIVVARKSNVLANVFHLSVPKRLCRSSLEMSTYYFENFQDIIVWCSDRWISEIRR